MSVKAYGSVGSRQKIKNATQSTQLEGQVPNSDGAFVYAIDGWQKLDRFLILGSEGGSYYASEKKLTTDNVDSIKSLIKENGKKVVDRTVEVSLEGKAPKNDPALLVLALASVSEDEEVRKYAFDALPKVARIGTHLFHFVQFRNQLAGWGRSMRTAISNWYNKKSLESVSFQIGKYQSRDGWSHRDLLRLAHVNPKDDVKRSTIYKWAVDSSKVDILELSKASEVLAAYEEIKKTDDEKSIINLVQKYELPMEMIPTDKRSKKVYEAMIDNFGITALIRNLGKLTELGILNTGNFDDVNKVCSKLTDKELLKKGRVHPIAILLALTTYNAGRGIKGDLTWNPQKKVVDALDDAFYLAFSTIEPTGKRIMLALDVSGSMAWAYISGTHLAAREASAAMAMAVARTEENYLFTGFTNGLTELNITKKDRLSDVVNKISNLNFSNTDCSLPMTWALKNKIKFDAFVVYTDAETNAYESIQPATALKQYRNQMKLNSRLVVNAMTSNGFSIADPKDQLMLDAVGLSSDLPQVISSFINGDI